LDEEGSRIFSIQFSDFAFEASRRDARSRYDINDILAPCSCEGGTKMTRLGPEFETIIVPNTVIIVSKLLMAISGSGETSNSREAHNKHMSRFFKHMAYFTLWLSTSTLIIAINLWNHTPLHIIDEPFNSSLELAFLGSGHNLICLREKMSINVTRPEPHENKPGPRE
jgi:hypothetical protein